MHRTDEIKQITQALKGLEEGWSVASGEKIKLTYGSTSMGAAVKVEYRKVETFVNIEGDSPIAALKDVSDCLYRRLI